MLSYLGRCIGRVGNSLEKPVTLAVSNLKEQEARMRSIAQEPVEQGMEGGYASDSQEHALQRS